MSTHSLLIKDLLFYINKASIHINKQSKEVTAKFHLQLFFSGQTQDVLQVKSGTTNPMEGSVSLPSNAWEQLNLV